MRVSFIVITHNRTDCLESCLNSLNQQAFEDREIIVLDNGSCPSTKQELRASLSGKTEISFHELAENRGVSGGRNAAIRLAQGDVLIFIDDDAILLDSLATAKIVERFRDDERLGILSFKSINGSTGKVERKEFPNPSRWPDDINREFDTYYYIGVAHAIRRGVFDKVGLYPDDFFYSMEEYDLSYRAVDAGFRIVYFPDVSVIHNPSPAGRSTPSSLLALKCTNKIRVAIRNMPWRCVLAVFFLWNIKTLVDARGDIRVLAYVARRLFRTLKVTLRERHVIAASTQRLIVELGGSLKY
jgi:GT2 family glycosyltransferase